MKQLDMIRDTVRHFYITLALQGIMFIALAVLILIYPPALFVLVILTFILIGLSLLAASWKIYSLWQKLPSFIKDK
jgi:ABC-type bacteriocin/lantibiotic exporter with double-glycine peptidase domain